MRWTATALFVVALPVFAVLTNVRVAALEPRVYEYSFDEYDAVRRTGVDRVQLDRAAQQIAEYFRNGEELLDIRVLVEGREEALFSPRETLHMRDVKALFRAVFRVHEIAFVYVVGYVAAVFLWSRERSARRFAWELVAAGGFTVAALSAAAAGVLVGFDALFRRFHLLSFSNDFWLLDPRTDALVQMFPQGFWFDVTLGVGVLTALEGGVIALIAGIYLAWPRRWRSGAPPPDAAARSSVVEAP